MNTNIIKNQYKKLGKKIDKKIKLDIVKSEWASYPTIKTIDIPLLISEQGEKEFLQTIENELEKQGHKEIFNDFDNFIWSFLHECGHVEKEKTYKDGFIRFIANQLSKHGFETIANKIYFNLKEEKTATEWACKWAIENYDLLIKYQLKIAYAYNTFYAQIA